MEYSMGNEDVWKSREGNFTSGISGDVARGDPDAEKKSLSENASSSLSKEDDRKSETDVGRSIFPHFRLVRSKDDSPIYRAGSDQSTSAMVWTINECPATASLFLAA